MYSTSTGIGVATSTGTGVVKCNAGPSEEGSHHPDGYQDLGECKPNCTMSYCTHTGTGVGTSTGIGTGMCFSSNTGIGNGVGTGIVIGSSTAIHGSGYTATSTDAADSTRNYSIVS